MNITTNQDCCINQHGCPFTVEGEAMTFNDKDKSREFRNQNYKRYLRESYTQKRKNSANTIIKNADKTTRKIDKLRKKNKKSATNTAYHEIYKLNRKK